MAEFNTIESTPVAGFVSSISKKNQDWIKAEEEEIAKLERQARGEDVEDEEESTEGEELSEETPKNKEEQTFKKRYGDLRRHHAEKTKELQAEIDRLNAQTPEAKIEYPADDETIDQWKRKYPDIAGIVETVAQKIADDKVKKATADFEGLKKDQAEIKRERDLAVIRDAHPDFDKITDTENEEFYDWVESQPKVLQDALYDGNDPHSAISVIDLYKVHKGITPAAKKAKAKEAAKGITKGSVPEVSDTGPKKWKESDVARMKPKEYEKYEEEIDKAIREGKFVYDLSGGAR